MDPRLRDYHILTPSGHRVRVHATQSPPFGGVLVMHAERYSVTSWTHGEFRSSFSMACSERLDHPAVKSVTSSNILGTDLWSFDSRHR